MFVILTYISFYLFEKKKITQKMGKGGAGMSAACFHKVIAINSLHLCKMTGVASDSKLPPRCR